MRKNNRRIFFSKNKLRINPAIKRLSTKCQLKPKLLQKNLKNIWISKLQNSFHKKVYNLTKFINVKFQFLIVWLTKGQVLVLRKNLYIFNLEAIYQNILLLLKMLTIIFTTLKISDSSIPLFKIKSKDIIKLWRLSKLSKKYKNNYFINFEMNGDNLSKRRKRTLCNIWKWKVIKEITATLMDVQKQYFTNDCYTKC